MSQALKIFIYILIIIAVFTGGFLMGRISSAKELESASSQGVQSDTATQDLLKIANLYGNIFSLSEQKHIADLNGDLKTAEETNVEINKLLGEVNKLLENYNQSINTESY